MSLWRWVVTIYVVAGCVYWIVQALLVERITRTVPDLRSAESPEPCPWPRVSAILPAHNEGDVLEAAVSSRLADDYPDLEIVLIDDRSTDQTVSIVKDLAARDRRVMAVRVDELPDGWWGKTHALSLGMDRATGDWILLSDSDVHVAPGTLKKAIAFSEARGLDHLTVLPEAWPVNVWLDAIFAFNVRQIFINARVWSISDSNSTACGGLGAFSLVRRTAFANTAGFEGIKLDVVDDYAVGRMLKQTGAKCAVANGHGCVGLQWYRNLGRYVSSMDRSTFTYWGGYSLAKVFGLVTGMLAFELFPALLLIPMGIPHQYLLAALALAVNLTVSIRINRWNNRPVGSCFLFPLGVILNSFIMARSGIRGYLQGGVSWGGVFYSTQELKKARYTAPRSTHTPHM